MSTTGWTWSERENVYHALLPRASMIVTGTQAGKEEVVRYYHVNPANVMVIPFPAPADALMVLGRSGDQGRNQTDLDLSLVLTGSDTGNRDYVMKHVCELGLGDRVFLPGFVPREDLIALYRASTALVFPSYFGPENFPPLEAFALGCPVIAANVPGAEEQIGQGALLFGPSNPSDIAAKIQDICRRPGLRAQMISKGNELEKVRTPHAYIATLCSFLDNFEAFRRCWGAASQHT